MMCLLFCRLNIHPHAREIKPGFGEKPKQMTAEDRWKRADRRNCQAERIMAFLRFAALFRRPCSKNGQKTVKSFPFPLAFSGKREYMYMLLEKTSTSITNNNLKMAVPSAS